MTLREVKQQFFAFRNGLLADSLRQQCGLPHKTIFGLMVPQLKEIAARAGKDAALARQLWDDENCRESRLLAPMVCPVSEAPFGWMDQVRTVEEADILCHSLLRHCPNAEAEAKNRSNEAEIELQRYAALRLLKNLQ